MLERRSRDREAGKWAVGPPQRLNREPHELVDVANVVGEKDEVLEILWRRPRLMLQPGQAEIGSRPVEQRQRAIFQKRRVQHAVGHLVADVNELGRRKPQR